MLTEKPEERGQNMSLQSRIETKLNAAFSPERLIVVNESHLHAGHHPDVDGTGETHMRVRIVSSAFNGMTRIARHRAINEILKEEIDAGLHALALEPAVPGETTRW